LISDQEGKQLFVRLREGRFHSAKGTCPTGREPFEATAYYAAV